MRKLILLALTLCIALTPLAACAADDENVVGGILAYLSGGEDIQKWIDRELSASAGSTMDNVIPVLIRMNAGYDFSSCIDPLAESLSNTRQSVTSRQRSALILSVIGASDRIPDGFADSTIGELGVMSYVFGLHLLNNGFQSEKWTIESLNDQLIAMQLEDGGWAVTGRYSDPDVTAMCLQAMSGCSDNRVAFINAQDRALQYLSAAQKDSAGYSSYGKEVAESSAQVITALCSMGIDPRTDSRFIKNGRTIMDALRDYRLPDGSYSHFPEGSVNTMACIQALTAHVAMENFGTPFFVFDGVDVVVHFPNALPVWKLIAFAVIALLGVISVVVSLLRKRAKGKRLIFTLLVCAIACAGVWCINVESKDAYYSEVNTESRTAGHVWLSVRCDTVAGRADDGSTPENGIILDRTEIAFAEGDSVFDVLIYAAREKGIHLEHEGSRDLTYINGINHLYEYAYGDLSGWMYFVNGEELSIGSGNYPVKDGDEVEWKYTLSMGEDFR